MGKRPLSAKQALFVKEYLVDLNATQAAGRAGYKDPNFGRQLLTKTNVAQAIEEAKAKRAAKIEVTQEYVITNLLEVVERCMQRAAITDAAGEETGVWKFDAKGATGALKLLGEHLGMFTVKPTDGGSELLAGLLRDSIRRSIERHARNDIEQSSAISAAGLAPTVEITPAYSAN